MTTMSTMDHHQLAALPAVLDVPTAAAALGLSRTTAYELIRTGEWPTPVFRLGRLIRIPTAPILELLGIDSRAGGFAEVVPVSTGQVVVPTTHEQRNAG